MRTERIPALPLLPHRDRARSLPGDAQPVGAYLQVSDGPDERLLPLDGGDVLHIGRSLTCDVVLEHTSVSRRQATLRRRPDGFVLHDDRSTNGTFVNGERVTDAEIRDGDVLTFGGVAVVFRAASRTFAAA
ncbi:MAG: FHA domain-containing protein [Solirubrobacteraceae bacterium]|nr:FHA domain-containing protein [Solirubrobacteraceae bacterium]